MTSVTGNDQTSDRRSKIVLAVDDTAENLRILKSVITSAGYSFIGVSSGTECLTLAWRLRPSLVLLDVQMPGMTGFEVCRRLRASREYTGVPIAFLTAAKTVEDVKAGMAAGGNDFIIKPFDAEMLIGRIHHWTSSHGRGDARATGMALARRRGHGTPPPVA
jgi:two-component system OmpR family response regulator